MLVTRILDLKKKKGQFENAKKNTAIKFCLFTYSTFSQPLNTNMLENKNKIEDG